MWRRNILQSNSDSVGASSRSADDTLPASVPLTLAQQEKWLGERYGPEAELAFIEAFDLVLDGVVDEAAMSAACDAVASRHEVLSMRFSADGREQIYSPPSRMRMEVVDLTDRDDPLDAYRVLCAEWLRRPFDLSQGDTARVILCRVSPTRSHMLLSAHHLVLDGWSLRIALQEMVQSYNAALSDDEDSRRDMPRAQSWRQFALTQHARAEGREGRASLDYWLECFRDPPTPLSLPTTHQRGTTIRFAASSMHVPVAASLWTRLKERSRTLKVTRFCLLLTGYAVLMHRLTGHRDIVLAVPFSVAALARARVLGDTEHTLPIRIRVDPETSLSDMARNVQDALDAAARNRDTSLGRIVQALPLARNAGRFLLTESLISLVPAMGELAFAGLKCTLRPLPRQAMAWELAVHCLQQSESAMLEVQYRADLFDPCIIEAWMQSYVRLLEQVADGDGSVATAELVSTTATGEAMAARSAGAGPVPRLLDLFDSAMREGGDRTAASCGDAQISFRELDDRSNAFALALRAHGMMPGALLGLSVPRSVGLLVAMLGALRAGVAYVPLDREFPAPRLRYMIEQSGLGVVLTASGAQLPPDILGDEVVLDIDSLVAEGGNLARQGQRLPDVPHDALAYLLYTSGSTGQPKGVRIGHDNLANFLVSMRERPGLASSDVLCAVTTVSFDISALELYLPLICGARVVIADDATVGDPFAICDLIDHQQCTVLQTTPALVALLLDVRRHAVLARLRLLLGGEALPPVLAARLLPICRELWNLYGPTEATVWATLARIEHVNGAVPIGQPIANTRVYVLDERLQPLPDGAIGELWIAGRGVAGGYHNRPDLTAERFRPDPFFGDGSSMYRTGDLGRWCAGTLYFEGRVDHQIKLRGYRIEPGEIESAAGDDPNVRDCVAVMCEVDGNDRLALYMTIRGEDAAHSIESVRARLIERLPRYMRPQYVVVLDQMPMTANGKLDRARLPRPSLHDRTDATRGDADDTLVRTLSELWAEMLALPHVNGDDDFFELGGDSLVAVKIFAALDDRYGINLPLAALLQHSTCVELAALIQRQRREQSMAPGVADATCFGSLVALNNIEHGLPIYFVHAIGGHALNYRALATGLDVPAYGLQSPEVAGAAASDRSIEDMAKAYIAEIRRVQPDGPYRLAGGSMGGVIAFEIARQLQVLGQQIDLLMLFDTYAPRLAESADVRGLWGMQIRLAGWMRTLLVSAVAVIEAASQRIWLRRTVNRTGELPDAARVGLHPSDEVTLQTRIERAHAVNLSALRRYRALPLSGDIHLVVAQSGLYRLLDRNLGWRRLVHGHIVIQRVPGRHDSLIESSGLAELLLSKLASRERTG